MNQQTQTTDAMQQCIDACEECHRICLQTAMTQCLETGGRHVEAKHFRLMMNCAEICQTSANFMLSRSEFLQVCSVCAEICEACAESCEKIGDMDACAKTCRQCAESCRRMAGRGQVRSGQTTMEQARPPSEEL
ncbi:MAG: four-helix bundle copper-binding protein [Nitrosomonadales bacterium SCN 54-20]|nr:MAG: four-helix bundle copper-binding protein [Nitrosomonadales bacterium SCN 54-20]